MQLIYGLLIVLIGIVSLLLIGAVLLQSGKGDGLSGMGGSSGTQQILGARQAPDFIQKATWALGSALLFLSLLTGFVIDRPGERAPVSAPATQAPATQAPAAPATTPVVPGAPGGTATPAPTGTQAPAPGTAPAPQN